MKNGLILDSDLKMSNIVELTEKRVKNINMKDLAVILMGLNEQEQKMMIAAIKSLTADKMNEKGRAKKYELIGHIIEIVAYRVEQRKVFIELKKREAE